MNDERNEMVEGQAGGDYSELLKDKGVSEEPQAEAGETPEALDAEPVEAEEVEPVDEAPPKRYSEDISTAPPTSPVPPHFPQGEQKGFVRPEGALPPAVRSAERVRNRDPRAKARARRAVRQ